MRPKAVISDLDGTLLDPTLEFARQDVQAAMRARAAGTRIGVATGRMYRSALPHAKRLGSDLPLICYQGALVKELPSADGLAPKVLFEQGVPREVAEEVLATCRRRQLSLNVYHDDQLYVEEINDDVRFYTGIAQVEAVVAHDPPLDQLVRAGSTKLTVVAKDLDRFAVALEEMRRLVGDRAEVTRSIVGFCEITARGVDKGHGLRFLCEHSGLDLADVVVIGDAPNDLPMLEIAGIAVAVETAAPEVRAVADWLVPAPGQGGLASVVKRLELDRPERS